MILNEAHEKGKDASYEEIYKLEKNFASTGIAISVTQIKS